MRNTGLNKIKEMGRKAFVKMGNSAIGNNDEKKGFNSDNAPVPFTAPSFFVYEKNMPKRKK